MVDGKAAVITKRRLGVYLDVDDRLHTPHRARIPVIVSRNLVQTPPRLLEPQSRPLSRLSGAVVADTRRRRFGREMR